MKQWKSTVSRLALMAGSFLVMAGSCGYGTSEYDVWGVVPGRIDVESRTETRSSPVGYRDEEFYRMRDPELGGFYPAESRFVNGQSTYVFTAEGNRLREQERLVQLKRRQAQAAATTTPATTTVPGGGGGGGDGGGGDGGHGDG